MGLMDIQTVAKYLGVSERTVYRLLDKEGLPGAKVGRQWRFDRQAVEEWWRHNRK